MKNRILFFFGIVMLAISLTSSLNATERVVVAEEVTATWCTYCPGAQTGIHELKHRTYDSLAVIVYHSSSSDPFYTSESAQRMSYYGISGYPTMKIDGILTVVGGEHSGNMYPSYRPLFKTRSLVNSPLDIELTLNYTPDRGTGTVYANIKNTGSSNVTGTLQFVLTETDIPYNWQGQTILYDVVRDMLPNANGESVSIAPGDSLLKNRDFTVQSSWVEENCNIVVFVQAASKEIYQGAQIAVVPETELTYYGLTATETAGNANGIPEPGESFDLDISLKNVGSEQATGISGTLSTSDPYITVSAGSSAFPDVAIGDVSSSSTPFSIDIAAGCPDPHQVDFILDVTANGFSSSDTFPFIVTTTPGLSDDMESGQGGWSHSGLNDEWHMTTHKSNSPTHSWYCGIENSWQYGNEIDASLISPYFVVAPGTYLNYYNYYTMETNYDYGYVDIDNGSGWWMTLDDVNGSHSYWSEETHSLSAYAGQTVRARFRFISDANTVAEGWYVDDASFGVPAAIYEENNKTETSISLKAKPISNNFNISLSLPRTSDVQLSIYNSAGRIFTTLYSGILGKGNHKFNWNRNDKNTKLVSSGVYFVKLSTRNTSITKKIILIR